MAKEKKENFKSDWAYSKKHKKNIHISEAESGLKGYRCLGCHSKMVANIQRKNPNWLSYFSHHASDVNKENIECVRASKTYREKIARSILNELKYINIPAIYKSPPLGSDENLFPMKIESRRKIEAAYTKAELSFYENEDGEIKWGKNPTITARDLLIRPDVTFFNKDNKPILFIEFIVYSKIKPDKFLKLSRLGIDTLQINIPRKSEADIEKALKSSRTYKWVYNEKEANTEYIPVFRKNTEDLSQINDNERIFFEEDFKCRQAEINWLIRSIKRNLQSEQHRTVELRLNQQIQKVKRNTESANQRLGDLEESNRKEALARNSGHETEEKTRYSNLERRYLTKRKELKRDLKSSRRFNSEKGKIEEAIKRGNRSISNLGKIKENIRRGRFIDHSKLEEKTWEEFKAEIEFEGSEIERIERDTEQLQREIRTLESDIPTKFDNEGRSVDRDIQQLREEERVIEETIQEEFREEIERIEREKKSIETDVRRSFNRAVNYTSSELPKRIKNLLAIGRITSNYEYFERKEKSYRKARELFRKGTWKAW